MTKKKIKFKFDLFLLIVGFIMISIGINAFTIAIINHSINWALIFPLIFLLIGLSSIFAGLGGEIS